VNSPTSELVRVFGLILILLITATVAGRVLASKYSQPIPAGIVNLNARINAWWVMVAMLAIAFLGGKTGVIVLFGFCSIAVFREFISITNVHESDRWSLSVVYFIILPVQYVLIWSEWYGLYTIFIPVYVFLIMPMVTAMVSGTKGYLVRIAEAQWAVMISIFCASHVPALMTLQIADYEGQQILLIAYLVVVVQLSDVFQYVCGKLIGKNKVAPKLSPSKTIEGTVGGILIATLIGAFLWWMTPFTFIESAGLAFVVSLMGFLGGLVLSAIKRDKGVKDWGATIAGHGGVIDRMDSVLFSAPIFFHLVRYGWDIT